MEGGVVTPTLRPVLSSTPVILEKEMATHSNILAWGTLMARVA